MGHECCGDAVAIGKNVGKIQTGDKVVAETHIPCGRCYQCLNGKQHICRNLRLFSIHMNGCFAGRLLPGTDLVKGIEKVCCHHGVMYRNILSIIGSLTKAKIAHAVVDQTGKIGIRYSEPVRVEGPLELLACQGVIGRTVNQAFTCTV
jgi:threonine dehydrogenase-like Zn-dependent dehydrogenase